MGVYVYVGIPFKCNYGLNDPSNCFIEDNEGSAYSKLQKQIVAGNQQILVLDRYTTRSSLFKLWKWKEADVNCKMLARWTHECQVQENSLKHSFYCHIQTF